MKLLITTLCVVGIMAVFTPAPQVTDPMRVPAFTAYIEPNPDGAKVLDRILAISPNTVTVLLTGWGETGHGCRSVATPVRIEELRRALSAP